MHESFPSKLCTYIDILWYKIKIIPIMDYLSKSKEIIFKPIIYNMYLSVKYTRNAIWLLFIRGLIYYVSRIICSIKRSYTISFFCILFLLEQEEKNRLESSVLGRRIFRLCLERILKS